jgi:predicted acetylornithine/succinylornithine family transaminase
MSNWQELERQYFLRTFDRVPITIVRGQGVKVWDDTGREYFDFVGGWACASLGHCHPVLIEAVTDQVKTLVQTSNAFYTVPQLQLAELLIKNSCLDRIFYANSGAEVVEGAIKLARRYGKLKLNGAYEVITALNSFHGRTLATTAATGQPKFQEPYLPMPAGFKSVAFNDIEAIKSATTAATCAVMLEPVQGEGGVNIPDNKYLAQVRAWCDEKGILLILDEVQTGVGRLGTLFGYEQFGAEPDIMTLAKGLGGGVPIGAFLAKERASAFVPGDHGSTFGGNPLVCAAGYAVVKFIIENNIPGNARKVGAYFLSGLQDLKRKFSFIRDVRGRGLLLAVEFDKDIGQTALRACLDGGLLVNRVKPNALRFMPPLNITSGDVDAALSILNKALAAIGG